RRRCTEVMTSTRRNGSSELLDIVVLIGACLCLIGYAAGPVKMGFAPHRLSLIQRMIVKPSTDSIPPVLLPVPSRTSVPHTDRRSWSPRNSAGRERGRCAHHWSG